MASFQAKIVWKRPRKRENKNYRFVSFLPGVEQKMPKKKATKLKKIPLWHHFKPKQFGKGKEREKIKIIVSFRPSLAQNLKLQKNCKKKFKKLKNASMASFKARIGWQRPGKKENKYCRSVSFLPNA